MNFLINTLPLLTFAIAIVFFLLASINPLTPLNRKGLIEPIVTLFASSSFFMIFSEKLIILNIIPYPESIRSLIIIKTICLIIGMAVAFGIHKVAKNEANSKLATHICTALLCLSPLSIIGANVVEPPSPQREMSVTTISSEQWVYGANVPNNTSNLNILANYLAKEGRGRYNSLVFDSLNMPAKGKIAVFGEIKAHNNKKARLIKIYVPNLKANERLKVSSIQRFTNSLRIGVCVLNGEKKTTPPYSELNIVMSINDTTNIPARVEINDSHSSLVCEKNS